MCILANLPLCARTPSNSIGGFMQEIFEVAKQSLATRRPEWAKLIKDIPLIRGGVERSPDPHARGWTIENGWYHQNNEVAQAFWDEVFSMCDMRKIRLKAAGIATGRDKRGRTLYYQGFVFTKP